MLLHNIVADSSNGFASLKFSKRDSIMPGVPIIVNKNYCYHTFGDEIHN